MNKHSNGTGGRHQGRRVSGLAGLATVAVIGLGLAAQQPTPAKVVPRQTTAIVPAPAFTGAQLAAPAGVNWPTNGGSNSLERFSTLSQINSGNVGQLRGVWETKLNGSGVGAKYSAESQPLEYDGTIYVSTGNDDVFAVSVTSGKILWEYHSKIPQNIATICCGWDNRGVAIGDGRVYIGQVNGVVVALNQQTGAVEWTYKDVHYHQGETVTAAAYYMDNTVYIGMSGGEFGARGFMEALNASTGAQMWRLWLTPAPGALGSSTWPNNGTYLHGGGSVWGVPSYDPATGLLYFGTGNAAPWYGASRPGDNLFTTSIVAVDAQTGQIKGWFQEVHHDIWDYDDPGPVVLYNTTFQGQPVQALEQATKQGWLFMIQRASSGAPVGPLTPVPGTIKNEPVPQSTTYEATSATQPIPQVGQFIPNIEPPASAVQYILKHRSPLEKLLPYTVATTPYTPFQKNQFLIYGQAANGADSWAPISYNPDTNMTYVCSEVQYWGATEVTPKAFIPGQSYVGLNDVVLAPNTGVISAVSNSTGNVVWQHLWHSQCRSGTVTTAGNIVFIGVNYGQLQAYNATTGQLLWSFQTGAGANDTACVYEYNGTEYVTFLAGGNQFATSATGDNLWTFALTGTLGPVAPGKIPPAGG